MERSPRYVFTLTAVNVLPDSSTGQLACWSADSHVVNRVDFNVVCQGCRDVGQVTSRLVDALERISLG